MTFYPEDFEEGDLDTLWRLIDPLPVGVLRDALTFIHQTLAAGQPVEIISETVAEIVAKMDQ